MDIPPEAKDAMPGAVGSLTALLFLREGIVRSTCLFVAGAASAYLLGPSAADMMGSREEVAGYFTGLFGMAVAAKAFELITSVNAKRAVERVVAAVTKRLGG